MYRSEDQAHRNFLKGTRKPVNYPFPRTPFTSPLRLYEFHLCFYAMYSERNLIRLSQVDVNTQPKLNCFNLPNIINK